MKPDRKRKFGFYWVRFEGVAIVAEYVDGIGCYDSKRGEHPHWHVPGSDSCFENREICELLSCRLELLL